MALLYFGSFCILLLYLVLNVVLAATYDGWKKEHSQQLLRLRAIRYHNLLVAWQVRRRQGRGGAGAGIRTDRQTDGHRHGVYPTLRFAPRHQVLLDQGTTLMSIDRWCELVDTLYPNRVSQQDKRQMFFFMDKDRSGGITRTEFTLHACDALR